MKFRAALPLGVLFAAPAAGESLIRHDTFVERLEALALIESLNADLLASRSATATLEAWCAAHHMAEDPKLHAKRVEGPEKPLAAEQRERLRIGADEPVKYRRVALVCGALVLSEADNWYVPARLTPEMNRLLEETDMPFGRVVQPLHPTRETFSMRLHYQPLEKGWEMRGRPEDHPNRELVLPDYLFEHRALLFNVDHQPFSEVDEHYTRALLDFAAGK